MPLRYLFGPVNRDFADQYLQGPRQAGDCIAFDHAGAADLAVGFADSWESVCARLPDGWRPDLVVLYLPYATVPAALWSAPVPLVAWAGDWDLLWHGYRRHLRVCDLVLADRAGAAVLTREGIGPVAAAGLFGCGRSLPQTTPLDGPRDLDLLVVGNLHPAVHFERLACLGRLARLGERRRVAIHKGAFGADYRGLLARARVVLPWGEGPECFGEAVAAGALPFREADAPVTGEPPGDDSLAVLYTADSLEQLLEHYLDHEDERRALVEAARARLPEFSAEEVWGQVMAAIEGEWPQLVERSRHRASLHGLDDLLARAQELLTSAEPGDTRLAADLAAALVERPGEASLHNALGLAVAHTAQAGGSRLRAQARAVAGYFSRAVVADPRHVLAGLNLAEALAGAGEMAQAAQQARRALAVLEQDPDDLPEPDAPPGWLDEGHFPLGWDHFRVEWERAAWQHAGQRGREVRAKRTLLRWRLHSILAEATGELAHYHEAALARPDLPATRAALGCALARAGRPAEAAAHLRRAVDANPLDRPAAGALFDVLGEVGDRAGRRRLARDRRLLHQAAPALVPAEPWSRDAPAVGDALAPRHGPEHPPAAREAPRAETQREPAVLPLAAAGRPRVSLCMIVKNEEANLPACLGSVADLVDETVVVDTGSTDRTREVAARYGARVADFPWVDSFAAARNEGLRHATGDWIFWMDADDRLDEANRGRLRALFAALRDENAAYVMKCLCLPDPAGHGATVVDHVRLFRSRPEIRWRYRVHEQILPAVRRLGGEVRWSDVVIHHAGYQDAELRGRKRERDLRLLGLENAEHPDDPFTLFNLGSIHAELGRTAEALPLLRRSLELSHAGDSIVRKLHALVAQCHRQLGQPREALAACRAGRGQYPEDTELLFLEGVLLREQGDRAGAEAAWQRLLATREAAHFASVDAGLRGPKARQNLAALFREEGRLAEAEAQWRAAVAEQPDFLPAWLGLAEVYLDQRRWPELEGVLRSLGAEPKWALEAAVLRARRHLAGKEFAAAREVLGPAIARAPQAVWPRVILSHALLQEGLDWAAAEQALRDVLALDPGHTEAQGNLSVLLRQLGRPAV
jgi:tetratricopeptide (TPR) repeat protein